MSEWQPIESAPKDGTVIDLWHQKYGRMTDTWWDDGSWVVTGTAEGFTHWMPTPQDPSAESKAIDEQIDYMRNDVDWYTGKVNNGRPMWVHEMDMCRAILATLERVKNDER